MWFERSQDDLKRMVAARSMMCILEIRVLISLYREQIELTHIRKKQTAMGSIGS
jgi:hypothetical protein